jgi:putative aldouronate transport system permease protein
LKYNEVANQAETVAQTQGATGMKPLHMAFHRRLSRDFRRYYALYLMILPALAVIVIFSYIPIYGVQMAFQDFRPALGFSGSSWAGLKYFLRFFQSYQFKTIVGNTVGLSLYAILASFPMPILLAILINRIQSNKYRRTLQTVTYLPHFISTVVVTGMVMIFLNASTGLYGHLMRLFGVEDPSDLMAKPSLFSTIYVVSDIWQHTGWESVIYLAALTGIDLSLYEAATVDGANEFQKVLFIELPGLLPTAIVLLILNSGNVMNVGFEKVYMLQNSLNLSASEVISTYVFKIGILNQQYSLSAAIGLFNNVINLGILLLVNFLASKISNISLW